jgi:hypothetical protein
LQAETDVALSNVLGLCRSKQKESFKSSGVFCNLDEIPALLWHGYVEIDCVIAYVFFLYQVLFRLTEYKRDAGWNFVHLWRHILRVVGELPQLQNPEA